MLFIFILFHSDLLAVTAFPASAKGIRPEQEDVAAVYFKSNSLYCGIFDGHGGVDVAADLKKILLERIAKVGCFEDDGMDEQIMRRAIASYFVSVNADILLKAYKGEYKSCPGSTALISFVLNNNKVGVANAGDSRAVLCRSGQEIQITKDHKVSDHEEAQRVLSLGGSVLGERVFGMLAVSRAFGDLIFVTASGSMKSCVEPHPDVFIKKIEPDDEFLIMASDGLWDTVKNNEAIEIVKRSGGPSIEACQNLVLTAIARHSADNISVIIIDLKD